MQANQNHNVKVHDVKEQHKVCLPVMSSQIPRYTDTIVVFLLIYLISAIVQSLLLICFLLQHRTENTTIGNADARILILMLTGFALY